MSSSSGSRSLIPSAGGLAYKNHHWHHSGPNILTSESRRHGAFDQVRPSVVKRTRIQTIENDELRIDSTLADFPFSNHIHEPLSSMIGNWGAVRFLVSEIN